MAKVHVSIESTTQNGYEPEVILSQIKALEAAGHTVNLKLSEQVLYGLPVKRQLGWQFRWSWPNLIIVGSLSALTSIGIGLWGFPL